MSLNLTIGYCTARRNPEFKWMLDSLRKQMLPSDCITVILVDFNCPWETPNSSLPFSDTNLTVVHTQPKPTVWQGKHRLTKSDYWATSNYRNTAICLCRTEWIGFLDDRCVLMPGYLDAIRDAVKGNYAVCGKYEKWHGMKVDNGVIIEPGVISGHDPRSQNIVGPRKCPGEWFFGCCTALPLEWALRIDGYSEDCDSLGLEDCIFGGMLNLHRFPVMYDERMFMVEDRTAAEVEPPTCKRTDKGISPNDKSHALLRRVRGVKTASPFQNLRQLRKTVLEGSPWPAPVHSGFDWYDRKPLSEFQ